MYLGYEMPTNFFHNFYNPIRLGGILAKGPIEESFLETKLFLDNAGAFTANYLNFICVGDVVSNYFYTDPALRKKIKYLFINGTSRRGTQKESFKYDFFDDFHHVVFENKEGTISAQLLLFLRKNSTNNIQYIIEIKGDENILVLPSLLLDLSLDESDSHFVFYGHQEYSTIGVFLPNGLVTIWNLPDIKKKAFNKFKLFKMK